MDFDLNDEQRQLSDSLERLLAQQYSFEQRQAIIGSTSGFSPAVWSRIAELGILSLPASEQAGGFGGGAVDLMKPMTLIGQALVVEPVLAHLVATRLLDQAAAGTGGAAELLQGAVAGEQRLAWARIFPGSGDTCTASRNGNDWTLKGRFTGVFGAAGADHLLVAADADHQVALFAIPVKSPCMTLHAGRALDNQRIADVVLEGVEVSAAQRVAVGAPATQALEDAADLASALLCAEAVGIIDFACQATLEYLKTRKQFGVPIGSFQALQHRIVDLHVELEQVRSMAALACSKFDAAAAGLITATERARAVSAARVLIAKAATKVAQESVQLHGGMGMAEEMKVSHAFRRLTVLAQQSGNVDYFLDRFIAADRSLQQIGVASLQDGSGT